MELIPKKFFLTKGVGVDRHKLNSFELALRNAQIASYNIVRVSSILPPHCNQIPASKGVKYLDPGQIVFAVMAESPLSVIRPATTSAAYWWMLIPTIPARC